jgi:molybdopterin synthase sulfur carrier subunit
MNITLLYFGRPREHLGVITETAAVPDGVATLGDLLAWLRARGANWADELADGRVRCAVNQEFCAPSAPLKAGDEVAIFSPISGG